MSRGPAQLLAEAKRRFVPLYLTDEAMLDDLLRVALATYQRKAGVLRHVESPAIEIPLPEHFLKLVGVKNAAGCHVPADVVDVAAEAAPPADGESESAALEARRAIRLVSEQSAGPFRVTYFLNLADWPPDKPLPTEAAPLVLEYLTAQISLLNTERARALALSQGRMQELPVAQELEQRLEDIKTAMEESQALLMPTMFCS